MVFLRAGLFVVEEGFGGGFLRELRRRRQRAQYGGWRFQKRVDCVATAWRS